MIKAKATYKYGDKSQFARITRVGDAIASMILNTNHSDPQNIT